MKESFNEKEALIEFAMMLEETLEQYKTFNGSDIDKKAMSLKASVRIIQFDLMKNFYLSGQIFDHLFYINKVKNPYARIRVISDQIKTIIEAREWLLKKAMKELREISNSKGLGENFFDSRAKRLKKIYDLSNLDKYREVRNSIGAHYDLSLAEKLMDFDKKVDKGKLLKTDMRGSIEYIFQWIEILDEVLQAPPKVNGE